MDRPALAHAVRFGGLCAGVGLAVGGLLALGAPGAGWGWFLVFAPVAAFISGVGAWWALAERGGGPSGGRGALAGAVAGLVAHPVCWALLLRPLGVADNGTPLAAALLKLWFISLVVLGWFTVLAGALAGWLHARWIRGTVAR